MSQRKEVIGPHELWLGDCREILPTLGKVDAVVTDPPYGINGGNGGDSKRLAKGAYEAEFQDTPAYIEEVCVPASSVALSIARRGAITPGIRCLHLYPPATDIGGFFTPASSTHGPWGFTCFQPVLFYGKDPLAGIGSLPSSISVTEAAEKNGHPCPKPIKAWRWLVAKVSTCGEIVLDPFMGSGTTGVACQKLGRKFIGIEIEPKYFDIACRRIEQAMAQPDLFVETPKPAEQLNLLDAAQ